MAVLALGAWSAFVAARLFRLAEGDIGYFVVAGTEFTDASSGLPLSDGPGYDGQFFHRLASDPLNSDDRVAGTVLDSSWRAVRIGYPLLAWLVSGVGFSTSAALVVVNLIAITVLGYLGGRSAQLAGRHAIWGLLLPMYFGFAFSIARNLAEVVATTALVAGVMLATQHRAVPAALCLSLAVLSRETVVAVVCVVGLLELTDLIRRRRPLGIQDSIWLMPLVVFGVWHLFVAARWNRGLLDIGGGTGSLRVPGVALIEQLPEVFSRNYLGEATLNVIHAMEVVVLLAVVGAAAIAMVRSNNARIVKSAFCGLLLLLLSADVPVGVWTDRNDLRMFAGVYAVAVIVLLQSKMRLHVFAASVGLCTLAAASSFVVGA